MALFRCLLLYYLVLFFSISNASDEQVAIDNSIFQFSPLSFSDFSFSIQLNPTKNSSTLGYSGQWWVSPNLSLTGGIKPIKEIDENSLYFSTGLFYLPDWYIFDEHIPAAAFGIHHVRWMNKEDYRWFHFGIIDYLEWEQYQFFYSWIRMFNNKNWSQSLINLQLIMEVSKKISTKLGFSIEPDNNISIKPFFGISLAL